MNEQMNEWITNWMEWIRMNKWMNEWVNEINDKDWEVE